jgi:hypothetical protein
VTVQEGVNKSNPEAVIVSQGAINKWQYIQGSYKMDFTCPFRQKETLF